MDFHVVSEDPLGLATVDGVIHLIGVRGGPQKEFHEVMGGAGKYRSDGVVTLRPVETYQVTIELLAGATLTLAFGVAVNTNYMITGASVNCSDSDYPQVTIDVIKPSSANKIAAYDGTIELEVVGGFGVVNKFGATAAADFAASSCSVEMLSIDVPQEAAVAGVSDYCVGGIYRYGFKKSCTAQARGVITPPASGAYVTEQPTEETRDGVKLYNASWWEYMDAVEPEA
jgi:hypothetical protein